MEKDYPVIEQSKIEFIMGNFDFEKVFKTMDAVGWTYWDVKGTPDIAKIRSVARYVLEDVAKNPIAGCKTGIFYARRCKDEMGGIELELSFVVAKQQSY